MSGTQPRRSGYGLLLLAIGRAEGFKYFGTGADSFLASLAPLVAFAIVLSALFIIANYLQVGIAVFLALTIVLLGPAVIAEPLCRLWQRDAYWPLYANILNWSKLLPFLVLPLAMPIAAAAPDLVPVIQLVLMIYGLWFNWFVARGALRISGLRALLVLIATQGGSNLLLLLPLLADSADRAKLFSK